ncbi:MAG: phosphotransferase, partial [Chloroflexi bacterium]|nr:phosphotransferase [Chloroflexota bacterium]
MTPFDSLTHRGQVQRLKRLAMVALAEYDLSPRTLTPLVHLFNTTFRIDTNNGRYVLRINRPEHRSLAEIHSEMVWLAAISRETELVVPNPLANRAGQLVTTMAVAGVPEPRHCALFQWVDGRFRRKSLNPGVLAAVGRFMARLHDHARQFVPPDGFLRQHLELNGEVGQIANQALAQDGGLLSAEQRQVVIESMEKLQPLIDAVGQGPGVYNLIHADLHQANYLLHNGQVRAIDFDDCGWGHLAYDIAVT